MSYKTPIDYLVRSSNTIARMPKTLRERLQPTSESLQKLGEKYGFEYPERYFSSVNTTNNPNTSKER